MLYNIVLTLHNIARWVLIIVALAALISALRGWLGKKAWNKQSDLLGMVFTSMFDLQLLLGLVLYVFLSPTTRAAFSDFGSAMSNALQRYFAVEHIFLMVIALVVAHVGRVLIKKAKTDTARFRRAAIWYTLALLLTLAAIPWPFTAIARPWLRLGTLFIVN